MSKFRKAGEARRDINLNKVLTICMAKVTEVIGTRTNDGLPSLACNMQILDGEFSGESILKFINLTEHSEKQFEILNDDLSFIFGDEILEQYGDLETMALATHSAASDEDAEVKKLEGFTNAAIRQLADESRDRVVTMRLIPQHGYNWPTVQIMHYCDRYDTVDEYRDSLTSGTVNAPAPEQSSLIDADDIPF